MAKESGLNVRLYVEGNDLSGDANALDGVGYTQEGFDTTTLSQSAVSRMPGRIDGTVSATAFFDPASTHIHAVATANSGKLPTVDQDIMIPLGASIGDEAVCVIAKESDYTVSGASGSPISVSLSYVINSSAPEFGKMLTAHDDTHSSASSNASVDNSASSASGGSAYLQMFSLTSGTATVKIEDSANNSSWADLTGGGFTAATGVTAERITFTGTVRRYVRVTTTGTFSNAKFACAIVRS